MIRTITESAAEITDRRVISAHAADNGTVTAVIVDIDDAELGFDDGGEGADYCAPYELVAARFARNGGVGDVVDALNGFDDNSLVAFRALRHVAVANGGYFARCDGRLYRFNDLAA